MGTTEEKVAALEAATGSQQAAAVKRMLSGEPTPGCECARCVAVRDTKGRAQC